MNLVYELERHYTRFMINEVKYNIITIKQYISILERSYKGMKALTYNLHAIGINAVYFPGISFNTHLSAMLCMSMQMQGKLD